MKLFSPLLFGFILIFQFSYSQAINRKHFFESDSNASLFIAARLKNLDHPQQEDVKRPAFAQLTLANDSSFEGPIELHARGKSRKKLCDPPPLMLYFKSKGSPLSKLGKLKLVWSCNSSEYYDQLIIKEYLIYKMYNLLTPYSYRVRLLDVQVSDSSKPGKPIKRKGFLIENIDDLAERLSCREYQDTSLLPMQTNQQQYALVTIFQYMIGNTDWSISNYQNIKLVVPDSPENQPPYLVPYDFDYSGLVNAEYAVPFESIPIENVRVRYNRATRLNLADIHSAAGIIAKAKPDILSLVESMKELKPAARKDIISYLNEFFRLMNDEKQFDNIFLKK
jgi:hypothetical protein